MGPKLAQIPHLPIAISLKLCELTFNLYHHTFVLAGFGEGATVNPNAWVCPPLPELHLCCPSLLLHCSHPILPPLLHISPYLCCIKYHGVPRAQKCAVVQQQAGRMHGLQGLRAAV